MKAILPDILTADWSDALKWDSKKHKIIHVFSGSNIYCTSDVHKALGREDCKEHLNYLENVDSETSFERLITKTTDIRVIYLNEDEWENFCIICNFYVCIICNFLFIKIETLNYFCNFK